MFKVQFVVRAALAALFSAVAFGQSNLTQVGVSFNIPVIAYGCCQQIVGHSPGQASLAPFGAIQNLDFSGGQYSDTGTAGSWTLIFTLQNTDLLIFNDPNGTAVDDNTAAGTATLSFGTGLFNGATGSIFYTIHCVDQCDSSGGVPVYPFSDVVISGHGVLSVPPSAAGYSAVTVKVVPAPGPPNSPPTVTSTDDSNGAFLIWLRKNFGGGGNALPAASGGPGVGTLQITPEWQPNPMDFTINATCPTLPNNCWIATSSSSGNIPAFSSQTISATINPPALSAGTYPANVALTFSPSGGGAGSAAASTMDVPLTLIVAPDAPQLALSTIGFQLQTVSGVAAPPLTKSVSVLNIGSGTLNFQASASTLSGGDWLSVLQSSGSATSAAPATVTISVNPAKLGAGAYFGRVDFSASGADASPQSVEVALTVLPPATPAAPTLSTTGLIFVAAAGTNPASQTIHVSSSLGTAQQTGTLTEYNQGTGWLSVSSPSSILSSSMPLTQTVSVNTAGLSPGIYTAVLAELVLDAATQTVTQYPVAILLVVTSTSGQAGAQPAVESEAPRAVSSCTPTRLLPVFTAPGDQFQVTAGLPVTVQASVVDDCGSLLNNGAVVASFGAADAQVALVSLGNGQWSGTWLPGSTAGGRASIKVSASSSASAIQGSASISGTLAANTTIPRVDAGGVLNAASGQLHASLAPGAYISIFGSNLAADNTPVGAIPYQTTLGGARVFLGGEPLPLVYAGSRQINAVIPYDVPVNTQLQLIVQNGTASSMPQSLTLAATEPGVFTQNGSGSGPGAVVVVKPDGTQFLNTPATPASAGDALVIYCTGLGPVDAAVAAGAAAPGSPPANTVNHATVMIGNQAVDPFFSGLTPGYFGLYQVNVFVPPGIPASSSVPLVVTLGGASSPPVTVAIK